MESTPTAENVTTPTRDSSLAGAPPVQVGLPTTGPVTWSVDGNGYPGELRFWRRLNHDRSWEVGGGFIADLYANSSLAYTWGFGGINVARLCDRNLHYFQIWRTTGGTEVGSSGQFYDYMWNGSRYQLGGPYAWHTTLRHGNDDPFGLEVDISEKGSWDFKAWSSSGEFPGRLRELHHYNDAASGEQQFWGSVYQESIAGYTLINLPVVQQGPVGANEWWVSYAGPYNFLRALDPNFVSFQVYRGHDRRTEAYRLNDFGGWELWYVDFQRNGTALHIDTLTGAQEPFTWATS